MTEEEKNLSISISLAAYIKGVYNCVLVAAQNGGNCRVALRRRRTRTLVHDVHALLDSESN
jgi:hypothetical protein